MIQLWKWFLKASPGGHEMFGDAVFFGECASSVPGKTLIVTVAGRHIFLDVCLSLKSYHWKRLANGDYCDFDAVIEADDWRNQPTRPNGLSWDTPHDTIPF